MAAANGRVAHPAMDWVTITGSERYLHGDYQPGLWDEEPIEGSLPVASNHRLISVLQPRTTTPELCWFAIWDGFGRIAVSRESAKLLMPNRPMVLFSGPIAGGIAHQEGRGKPRSWPEDRAWCVATDVDLMTTYVGASEDCVHDLIATVELERC